MDLSYLYKEKIRETKLHGLTIGGAQALPFMSENNNRAKPLIAVELPYRFDNSFPNILKKAWKSETFEEALKEADGSDADLISIKFNLNEENFETEIEGVKKFLASLGSIVKKPLILRGANNNEIDKKLVPILAKHFKTEAIIAFADEHNYEQIAPSVLENNHILVLRTPIDINLAKELNILTIDKGISPERILIDPDMGGLGYGLDYGYSIIERIRQAAFDGDTMLNMPIIAFIGEESYRAKESKTDSFGPMWGEYSKRAAMWEVSGASAMISAGADIVVLWNPNSIKALKGIA